MSLLLLLRPGTRTSDGTFATRTRITFSPANAARLRSTMHNYEGAGIRATIDFATEVTEPVEVTLRPPGADPDGSEDINGITATRVYSTTPGLDDCALELIAAGRIVYQFVFTGATNGSWHARAESGDSPPAVGEGVVLVKASVFV